MRVRRPVYRLAAVGLCALALFALAAWLLPHSPGALRDAVARFGWAAPLCFVGLWAVVTPALFSGTVLALAGGVLFGPVEGTLVGVAGATLGGLLSFAIARHVGAGALAQVGGRRLARVRRVEGRVAARPFRAIVALRLMPGMPATWLNYAVGLTRVRALPFALANAAGGGPRVFIYAALGGSLHASAAWRTVSIGLFAALAVLGLLVAWRTRRPPGPAAAGAAA